MINIKEKLTIAMQSFLALALFTGAYLLNNLVGAI